MRLTELKKLLPTQFKRISSSNPLYSGHDIIELGHWTKDDGFIKKQTIEYNGEVLGCPVIGIVESKFGSNNVKLTIKGKVAEYLRTDSRTQGDYTITRKVYKTSSETITGALTIPRFTRPYATFLITGLGQKIYDIVSISDNVSHDVGTIRFYALASNGAKILYWYSIHKLAEEARDILRPWIAPTVCKRCGGTGIEPDTVDTNCLQCNSYGYSGFSSIKKVQRDQGVDVGITREEIPDWENMTNAEKNKVNKFINKAWTQKWWVTPTKTEIRRLFAHFYNISQDAVQIYERFNKQEPVWRLTLPNEVGEGSPFGTLTEADRELLRYIAKSITPAGVSVFVGFYRRYYFGNFEDFDDDVFLGRAKFKSSIEPLYSLYDTPRWDFYNGWTEATEDFEQIGITPNWENSGSVSIVNINDINRHMCKLEDNSYIQTGCATSGYFELWCHPMESIIRFGIIDGSNDWLCYTEYNQSGFYDNLGNLLTLACEDSDYHISVDYEPALGASGIMDVRIQRYNEWENISFSKVGSGEKLRIECISGEGYVDAIGLSSDPNYTLNDNWQRLYPCGWGLNNENEFSGEVDLLNNYFYKDRPILI